MAVVMVLQVASLKCDYQWRPDILFICSVLLVSVCVREKEREKTGVWGNDATSVIFTPRQLRDSCNIYENVFMSAVV